MKKILKQLRKDKRLRKMLKRENSVTLSLYLWRDNGKWKYCGAERGL